MNTSKRNEHPSVPDGAQTCKQPQEPVQRETLPHVLHRQSRGNASSAGMIPAFSRVFPSVSQVPPAFPRRIPSFGRARMLQPSVGPCDRVRIHPVMWMSLEVVPQEAGK
jgi:hypothetical protein